MKLCKLTDQNGRTYKNTQWGKNVTHTAKEIGRDFCTEILIHAYRTPVLAVLMNPVHARIKNPILWESRGGVVLDDGTKVGCKSLTTIKKIPVPHVTREQKVRFAILCALSVYNGADFAEWAHLWLTAKDRTKDTALAVLEVVVTEDSVAKPEAAMWALAAVTGDSEPGRTAQNPEARMWALKAVVEEPALGQVTTCAALAAKAAARKSRKMKAGVDLVKISEEAVSDVTHSPPSA
jgi:hypothetical protein